MEYYSAIKKNKIMPSAAMWMDLETILVSEVSQTKKDKYHVISLTWDKLKFVINIYMLLLLLLSHLSHVRLCAMP